MIVGYHPWPQADDGLCDDCAARHCRQCGKKLPRKRGGFVFEGVGEQFKCSQEQTPPTGTG